MAEDDVGVVVLDAAERDEANSGFLGVGARHQIFLGVDVNIGRGILEQDFFFDPLFRFFAGAGVDVVLRRIAGQHAAFFDGDQVVGALGVIGFLHRGANLVVGLGEHVARAARGWCRNGRRETVGFLPWGLVWS